MASSTRCSLTAFNGLVGTDAASFVLNGSLSRALGEHVGNYAITQGTLAANSNYVIHFTAGQLAITPAPLTITADHQTKTYGQADPTLTFHASGFQFNDTPSNSLTGTLTRTPGEHVASGPYAITQGSLASDPDYTVQFTGSTLLITRPTLTYTIGNDSQTYGTAANLAADLPATIPTGVNGEAFLVNYTSPGDLANAHAGSYAIDATLSDGTALASDYSVKLNSGTLTVNKAKASFVVNGYTVLADGNPHTATGAVTGIFGELLTGLDLSATTHTAPGSYSDTWTFTDTTGNYTDATGTASDVIACPITAIAASIASGTYGGQTTLSRDPHRRRGGSHG